jgi:DNA primase
MIKTTREILSNYGIKIHDEKQNDYLTLCPFHNDNSPSFSIRKDNGVYHCWSCGAKGNLVTFVKNIEHISYDDAKQKVFGDDVLLTFVDFTNTFIKKKVEKQILI